MNVSRPGPARSSKSCPPRRRPLRPRAWPSALACVPAGLVDRRRHRLARRQPEAGSPPRASPSRQGSRRSRRASANCEQRVTTLAPLRPDQPQRQPRAAGHAGRARRGDRRPARRRRLLRAPGRHDRPAPRPERALGRVRARSRRHLALPGDPDPEPQPRRDQQGRRCASRWKACATASWRRIEVGRPAAEARRAPGQHVFVPLFPAAGGQRDAAGRASPRSACGSRCGGGANVDQAFDWTSTSTPGET